MKHLNKLRSHGEIFRRKNRDSWNTAHFGRVWSEFSITFLSKLNILCQKWNWIFTRILYNAFLHKIKWFRRKCAIIRSYTKFFNYIRFIWFNLSIDKHVVIAQSAWGKLVSVKHCLKHFPLVFTSERRPLKHPPLHNV